MLKTIVDANFRGEEASVGPGRDPRQRQGLLEIVPVSRMDEVLGHALTRKAAPIVWDEASAKPAVDTPAEEKSSARTAHWSDRTRLQKAAAGAFTAKLLFAWR
jgi:hypothetical protein